MVVKLSAWPWLFSALMLVSPAAAERTHVVGDGHTLGKIAKRYHVSIAAICNANGIQRNAPIKPGQKLVIPDASDEDGSRARSRQQAQQAKVAPEEAPKPPSAPATGSPGMQVLRVPGYGNAYYYEPTGPGRLTLRPVMMYLHGRGGQPEADCRRWAAVARPLGWLVCPSGPGAMGKGRGWNNNWATAHRITVATLNELRNKYGRRVQLYGNTLIGFSEGAYAAMNVGLREPRSFNRWLVLAANSTYWGALGQDLLGDVQSRVRKVYLITGERDEVVEGTRDVREILRKTKVATRISTPGDLGHEVDLDGRPELYRAALMWLNEG